MPEDDPRHLDAVLRSDFGRRRMRSSSCPTRDSRSFTRTSDGMIVCVCRVAIARFALRVWRSSSWPAGSGTSSLALGIVPLAGVARREQVGFQIALEPRPEDLLRVGT